MMMKTFILLCAIAVYSLPCSAQAYHPATTRTDAFSQAIVSILNCATTNFKTCKGDSIRSTWLLGTDYHLSIPVPGATAAIVRSRDFDNNVYIEFRGYKNERERTRGFDSIISKLKWALGDQLYDPYPKHHDSIFFHGLHIKDGNGYFGMNMELFGSSSSEPSYLLGPEHEDPAKPKTDLFILLKIYDRVPYYQYFIREIQPPDPTLHTLLKDLYKSATSDFKKYMPSSNPVTGKTTRIFTSSIQDQSVRFDFRGGSHKAILEFPLDKDSLRAAQQFEHYHKIMQAVAGTAFMYTISDTKSERIINYFKARSNEGLPRMQLEMGILNGTPVVRLEIISGTSHPVKAALDRDDD